jgi:nucleotide-binding universal stress UspA family protein
VAVAPKRFRDGPPRTVGVGFDGSDESRAALHLAAAVAAEHDASLTLYIVWETPPMPVAVAAGDPVEVDRLLADSRSRAERLLADALAGMPGRVTGHTLHGRPALHLEEAARQLDLLVVGSRGWGPVKRVALGSTSDWLVHRAACPVLVVPRPQPAAAQRDGAVASTADITA